MSTVEWRDVRRPVQRTRREGVAVSGPANIAAFLLGFVLQFNPLSSTYGLPFLRLSDALMFVAAFFFFWRLRKDEVVPIGLRVAALGALIVLSILFKAYPLDGDTYFSLMLLASFLVAVMFVTLENREPRLVTALATGILIGMILSTVVLLLRAAGVDLTSFGLGVTLANVGFVADLARAKPGGLWAQGNEAGHVYAVAGAAALYLSYRFKKPSVYGLYYMLFLATFVVTLNRGGVIAPTIGLAVAYVTAGKGRLLVRMFLAAAGVITILAVISWLPMFEELRTAFAARFEGDSNLAHNISDRVNALAGGLQVALRNPFGIGFFERGREIISVTQVASGSPHNAILSLSYQAGLGVMILYVMALALVIMRRKEKASFATLVAFFALPSMFFEELTLNPNFLFAVALTIAVAFPLARPRLRPNLARTRVPQATNARSVEQSSYSSGITSS